MEGYILSILLKNLCFRCSLEFPRLGDSNEYCKVPKFFGREKLRCNSSKIQTKRPNLKVFCQKYANGLVNSEDPDQTAPLGAV